MARCGEDYPFEYDREHVVMLSDWTFEDPRRVMGRLKKQSDYYNFQQRTIGDFFRDAGKQGFRKTVSERLEWGRMRMDPTDILDVTGYTYTHLVNDLPPEANWTGLFRPGERVRLLFINGSAMTFFNIRVPGLEMTVVQADGQNIAPVRVDELQMAAAETYDVVVQPRDDRAYTVFAESMDRSGYGCGTLVNDTMMNHPFHLYGMWMVLENGTGLGARLRYEIRREFAPYIGLSWVRKVGETADMAERNNEGIDSLSLVVGVRLWF